MDPRIYEPRIIALDLRPRRIGFAVMEGPRRLLDYGTVLSQLQGEGQAGEAIVSVFRLTLPSVIVAKQERWDTLTTRPKGTLFADRIRSYVVESNAELLLLDGRLLKKAFRDMGCQSKAEIVDFAARMFPELLWKAPPKRKAWQPEHSRQTLFDAVALGMIFWQCNSQAILEADGGA